LQLVCSEPASGFANLGLRSSILAAVDRAGYQTPTPIQSLFIPQAVHGRDVLAQSQTGTGKTAAYLLPILNGLRKRMPGPQALVLGPTRELVRQIKEESDKLSPHAAIRTVAVYGGQSLRVQMNSLAKGAEIVIGTPGRLLDFLARGVLKLDLLKTVILDEADRMLDIGFRPDIEKILRRCPKVRQTNLLSATLSAGVRRLAQRYQNDPVPIYLSPDKPAVDTVRQTVITVDATNKFALLLKVLEREQPRQCIIFCATKIRAGQLCEKLRREHQKVATIHGDLEQRDRDRVMGGFRDGSITILTATDIVSRGIDVMGISHIINYDIPEDPENYVHRIGRTGRMGKDGIAIMFVTPEQGKELTNIEMVTNQVIEHDRIEGFDAFRRREPKPDQPAEPKPLVPVFGRRVKRYSRGL
jgi:ATP-dependent RNA helicase DeaD